MASSCIALSTFIRIAKDGSPTDTSSAVTAIKAATGFPDSPSLDANQASLLRLLTPPFEREPHKVAVCDQREDQLAAERRLDVLGHFGAHGDVHAALNRRERKPQVPVLHRRRTDAMLVSTRVDALSRALKGSILKNGKNCAL